MAHLRKFHEESEALIRNKYELLRPHMTERCRRIWAGAEARSYGFGGVALVSRATGISYPTVLKGLKELDNDQLESTKIRKGGGGNKKLVTKDLTLLSDLQKLINPVTRGDPESPLLWTSKSVANLGNALRDLNHSISDRSVYSLLKQDGYSLQSNRKKLEGASSPDRDAQFEYINNKVIEFQQDNNPVISVDSKKKEQVGNYQNNGVEYHKKGDPDEVNTYDFPDKDTIKATPYGVYDLTKNNGWVSVGISKDTAEFAVEAIKSWWYEMGKSTYPKARKICITADFGGSNGYRTRLWKFSLQRLSNELGIEIHVSHFPPGTSKWNKIEHKMFSFIARNWRGRPLINTATIVNLIGNTTNKNGLKIKAKLDNNHYEAGIKITDEEFDTINIINESFKGEWNYIIKPIKY